MDSSFARTEHAQEARVSEVLSASIRPEPHRGPAIDRPMPVIGWTLALVAGLLIWVAGFLLFS